MTRRTISLAAIVALTTIGSSARAQVANASTAATALGGAYTARAQGYNAVAWNPANLAMPGNPGFSFTMAAIDAQAGMRPIDLKRIANAGATIDSATREAWMTDVEREGAQRGAFGSGVTYFGLSIGSAALQVNTKVVGNSDLGPGAVEAMLFGNEGRTGSVRTLDLTNSAFGVTAYSTGALSYGLHLPMVPLSDFAIGVTAKYIVGHATGAAQSTSSLAAGNQIDIEFPYVGPSKATRDAHHIQLGTGMGLDLGAAWRIPGFRFGVSAQNVLNTFKWDTSMFAMNSAVGLFNDTQDPTFTAGEDSTEKAFSAAPAALRDKVINAKFKPVLAAGVAFDWLPAITLSADIRQQASGGIETGPSSIVSAGAELHLIPLLPIRGGVQMMTGGFGVSGGVGLHVLGFEAGLAGYLRTRDGAQESGATINFISIRP